MVNSIGNGIWRTSSPLWCSTNAEEYTAVPLVVFFFHQDTQSVLACWGVHVDYSADAVMHTSSLSGACVGPICLCSSFFLECLCHTHIITCLM